MSSQTWIKFWRYFSTIVIVGTFGVILQVAVWIWYPYNIIDFKSFCYKDEQVIDECDNTKEFKCFNGIVKNEGKKVKRGEYLIIELHYNKYIDIPTRRVNRNLVNDRYITLVMDEGGAIPIGKAKKEFAIFIPKNIWPGKYRLVTVITYKPNPIREVHENWVSEVFEIVE